MQRMTRQTRMVLTTILKDPDTEFYGLQVCAETGLKPGTVYHMLKRMENDGWLVSEWEQRTARKGRGGPPRRYFRFTSDGRAAARQAAQEGTSA